MSVANRIGRLEIELSVQRDQIKWLKSRFAALEEWKATIEGALLAEDEQEEQPVLTLDGEDAGGERNQDEPL